MEEYCVGCINNGSEMTFFCRNCDGGSKYTNMVKINNELADEQLIKDCLRKLDEIMSVDVFSMPEPRYRFIFERG